MLFEKLKVATFSLLPLMGVIFVFYFLSAPFGLALLHQWLVGCALLVVGLALFLTGAEVGLVPFGQAVGAALPHSRNMPLVLVLAFVFGVGAAYAEPCLHFIGALPQVVSNNVHPRFFTEGPAFGVGFFAVIGVARILLKIPLKKILLLSYPLVFLLCWFFVDPDLLGLVFASGGGATGPILVALLMALGMGVTSTAKVSSSNSASFGLIGLLSLGVIFVTALTLIGQRSSETVLALPQALTGIELLPYYLHLSLGNFQSVAFVLIPLAGLFLLFQALFLKLPGIKARRMALGIVYAGFGMMLILTGLMGGLVPGASFVGETLGQVLEHTGDKALVMAFSAVFGFVAMYLEPAVWVWGTQVTNALGGSMKRHMLVGLLCLSGAMGGALGMAHVLYGISVWGILGIGYLLALGLTLCTPRLYIGIAFDAGGVVIGPVSLFFLLTFVVGVSHFSLAATQGSVLVVMACIAMVPLVILQLFGLIFSRQEAQAQGGQR